MRQEAVPDVCPVGNGDPPLIFETGSVCPVWCAYNTCEACNDDANCGWCGETQTCAVLGGPDGDDCPGPIDSICFDYCFQWSGDCDACLERAPDCGYCGANEVCSSF